MFDSPYLINDTRLGDVIAALQAMGSYKFYKLEFAKWSDRISGDENKADHWKKVFEEHPEFFRLDSGREKASLVWRRQHQKLFNVDTEVKITRNEYKVLSNGDKERISRTPLSSDELGMLVQTAIELHSRALQRKQDARWWIPVAVPAVSALIGVILGYLL